MCLTKNKNHAIITPAKELAKRYMELAQSPEWDDRNMEYDTELLGDAMPVELKGHGYYSVVSPAMHDEFEIQYILPIAERFAYIYYGCCEPLDNKMDVIK